MTTNLLALVRNVLSRSVPETLDILWDVKQAGNRQINEIAKVS